MKRKLFLIMLMTVILSMLIVIICLLKDNVFLYDFMKETSIVRHACGGAPGKVDYTNSKEALELSLRGGANYIEVDFDIDENGQIVVSHGENLWRKLTDSDAKIEYTKENIKTRLILGEYHSLTLDEICKYMNDNKHLYLITDTKYTDSGSINLQFEQIVQTASKYDESVINRIVPQIYNEEMLDIIMQIYSFKSIIYTLYNDEWDENSVLDICDRTGVKCVAIGNNWFPENKINWDVVNNWMEHGIKIAVFTVNDINECSMFADKGISLIYSDNINQEDLAQCKE